MNCAKCEKRECTEGKDCTGRRKEIAGRYADPAVSTIMKVAAGVEADFYCEKNRVEEVIEFAKRMGYKRIGVAFCIGFMEEAKILVPILEQHFEVSSVCCKVAGLTKEELGQKTSDKFGKISCNPVGQAEVLKADGTDLNILCGLCVGHDILFTQHSHAPVTTLIVKDRVLGHNPVAALYCRYIRRRLTPPAQKR